MNQLFSMLNQNSGAILVVFSAVVAFSTIMSGLLALRLLKQMKDTNSNHGEPRIDVTYRPRDEWVSGINLVVKNIGPGSAHDIKFNVKPISEAPITRQLIKTLEKSGFIRNGLEYLSPAQEVGTYFTNINENTEEKVKAKLKVSVSYKNDKGREYINKYLIDLAELEGTHSVNAPPMHKIADNIESIHKELSQITSGFRRLKMDVYTEADRQTADSSRKDYLNQMREKHQSSKDSKTEAANKSKLNDQNN